MNDSPPFARWERPMVAFPILAGLAMLFYWPHLSHWSEANAALDWRYFQFLFEAGRAAVRDFHQFPAWNPYACGGYILHANPQTPFLSPLSWPALVLETMPAMNLYVLLHLTLGLWGAYWLARTLDLRGAALYLLPIAFGLGTRFIWILQGGQFSMLTFCFLPALLAAVLRGHEDWRALVGGAVLLGIMLLEGGTYGVPLSAFLLVLFVATGLALRRLSWRSALMLTEVFLLGALLAGPKLLPTVDYLNQHPRTVSAEDDALGPSMIAAMFIDRHTGPTMIDTSRDTHPEPMHYFWWGEYGAYLNPLIVLLALSACLLDWRRSLAWLVPGALAGLTMLGNHGRFAPYQLLRLLPIYGDLRVPSRYSMLIVLCAAVLASLAMHQLVRRMPGKRWPSLAAGLLCLLVAGDQITFSHKVMNDLAYFPIRPVNPQERFTTEVSRSSEMETYVRLRRATLDCYEALFEVNGYRTMAHDVLAQMKDEVEFASGSRAPLTVVGWTPNRITIAANPDREDTLILRSNYDPHWVANAEVVARDGRLAVKLPPGARTVQLHYSNALVGYGFILTLVGVVLGGIMIRVHRRPVRRNAQGTARL